MTDVQSKMATAQIDTPRLTTTIVTLRPFSLDDVDDTYRQWLFDPEVIRYLEVRFDDRSLPALRAFAEAAIGNPARHFFAIETPDGNDRIGTASLRVRPLHRTTDFGYLIGDGRYWGTDAALATQVALFDFAFGPLDLRKVHAGTYATNRASLFNFRRLGFAREGIRRAQYLGEDRRPVDEVLFGLLRDDWASVGRKFDHFRVTTA